MQAGKWYQVGNPFVELEDSVDTVKINDVYNQGFGEGDILCLLNSGTSQLIPLYWNEVNGGWSDSRNPRAPLSEATIMSGQAVYITKSQEGVLTFKGKVQAREVSFGMPEGNSWDQVVLLWPETKKLKELAWSGLSTGDTLNILNPETAEVKAYYWNEALTGWSDSRNPRAPLTEDVVNVGHALYINKVSTGIGTLNINQ